MRNKKLLSTVVASALVATTMAMPVMAADGGSVKVEFTTKTPVIRVSAPTSIVAAVDPLEMNTPGTQIHSGNFALTNKSEVAVGIDVKSVAKLGTDVTLVDTKTGAADSKGTDVWLAVAAQTSSGKYIEDATKTAGDLTETDGNVVTFKTVTGDSGAESSASQTFYLNKAASSTATHTVIAPVAANAASGKDAEGYKKSLTYAQVHEIEEDTTITDTAKLLAKLQTMDVYEGSDASPADGSTLTLFPAGKTDATFTTGKHYFTVKNANQLTSITDGKVYVYGEGGTGGSTAFRYIGKLGSGKTSWSDTDVDEIQITYSIYGLTDDQYTEADVTSSYGLYTPVTGPQVTISQTGLITMKSVTPSVFKSLVVNDGAQNYEMNSTRGSWKTWSEDVDTQEFQLNDAWVAHLSGKTATVTLTLKDDKTYTASVTVP